MKRFIITATKLHDLTHVLTQLKPEAVARVLSEHDALKANRLKVKVCRQLRTANTEFVDAITATEKAKTEIADRYTKDYLEKAKDLNEADKQKLARELSAERNKLIDEAQAKSTAKPDVEISVILGDEEYASLVRLYPATVGTWLDSEAMVTTADDLENVAEASA